MYEKLKLQHILMLIVYFNTIQNEKQRKKKNFIKSLPETIQRI